MKIVVIKEEENVKAFATNWQEWINKPLEAREISNGFYDLYTLDGKLFVSCISKLRFVEIN